VLLLAKDRRMRELEPRVEQLEAELATCRGPLYNRLRVCAWAPPWLQEAAAKPEQLPFTVVEGSARLVRRHVKSRQLCTASAYVI
jgi:hypothetical protein